MDAQLWWDRYKKYCILKTLPLGKLFRLCVDNVLNSWYRMLGDAEKADNKLGGLLLTEVGEMGDKTWDRRREVNVK